ncbi:MAG: hypothetical protein FD131_4233 [Rhodocyclaceae bacterium]|nr:MAG: hypothetical protein FD131_4233 [Rhodocyclaceae bacterium]
MTKPSPNIFVADFITQKLAESDKTQCEISQLCGFENANVMTMIKTGKTKLPINRIGPFAKALEVDPAYLLRLVLSEYLPDTWQAIEAVMQTPILSRNEADLICKYRRISGNTDTKADVVDFEDKLAIVAA